MSSLKLSGFALVIMFLITGCNSSSSSSSSEDGADFTLASFLEDGDALNQVIADFEEETGYSIEIQAYSSEASAMQSIIDGESADVVVFPQPARIHALREEGLIEPLRPELYDKIKDNSMTKLVEHDSQAFALPYAFSVKSIVWYSRSSFDNAGLTAPANDDDWETFIVQVNNATDTDNDAVPDHTWCIGLEDETISAGDWFEELLLQTSGIDTYNLWTQNDSMFEYRDKEGMLNDWKEFYLDEAQDDLNKTNLVAAAQGIQGDTPDCFLHTQASWINFAFSDIATSDDDGDIDLFALPIIGDNDHALRRIGGEFLTKVNNVDGVDEFLAYVWEESSRASVAASGRGKMPADTTGDSVIAAINDDYILKKLNDWYSGNLVDGRSIEDVEVFDGTDLLPVDFAKTLEEALKEFALGDGDPTASEALETIEDARP